MHSSKLKHIAFALTLAFTPLPILAAGLGKLNVMSGLGEPLRADIELLSVSPDELATISAAIATNEAYQNQGLEKPRSHNDIKIEVTKNARGMPILKLNSNQPITDAFLDMLIQVDWSSGRLLREYTLLLDPPGYNSEIAETIQAPVSQASAQVLPPKQIDTSVAPLPTNDNVAEKAKPVKKPTREQSLPVQEVLPEATTTMDAQAYTTQRGDTLAKIAREMKPEGVSLDQMLVGLYQANPNAFDGKNMNRLKVGQIVRAPSEDQLSALTSKSASKQVRIHSANWNAYKNKLAGIVADSQPQETEISTQSSQGKVTAAEDRALPSETGPKDVVKLSAGENVASKQLQDKLNAIQEESIAKDNALKEAESRTADLQKQIEDMKKLLALKNDAMAKIQQDATVSADAPVANPAAVEDTQATAVVVPAETVAKETPAPTAQAEAKQPTPQPPNPVPTTATAVDPFMVEEPSFIGGLTENLDIKTLGLGGAALALMGGGWLYLRNKRKKNLASFEEGIMTSGGLKANTVFGNTAGGTVDTGDTSFLTDFSQGTNGGMIDAHDVDPIAEAEVYMAYGRDAQAEEILKDAIVKEPKRYELHLKLLEIYQTNGNTSAFDAISGELYTTLGASNPVWAKVAQLGIKMDPSNPLYAQGFNAAAVGATQPVQDKAPNIDQVKTDDKDNLFASLEQSTTLDMPAVEDADPLTTLDDLLKGDSSAVHAEQADASSLDFGGLEFEVTPPTLEDTPVIANAETVQTVVAPMTLDAPSIFAEPSDAATEPLPESLNVDAPNEDLAFTRSALTLDIADAQVDSDVLADLDISSLDVPTIDFPSLEIDLEDTSSLSVQDEAANSAPALSALGDDNKVLDPNPDPSFQTTVNMPASAFDDEANKALVADFGQSGQFGFTEISLDLDDNTNMTLPSFGANGGEPEEVETKLDLVMAYLDMEDKIGAKELLEEVLKEGGENQRKRANELLEKIA